MAKRASFKTQTRAGESVTVYGEVCTKYANYGFYNLSRFENGLLTAQSFKNLMTGKESE